MTNSSWFRSFETKLSLRCFDSHGGKKAAKHVSENMWDAIQCQPNFHRHDIECQGCKQVGIDLHNEIVPHRRKCLLCVGYRCLSSVCMHSRFMHLGKWVHTCTAQGDSFRERNSIFCWRVLTQRQHVIAVQLCSVAAGHVPMFSVELEFVLCKLCCMHCSCTVSMHTVLFYSACWKRHKTGDLSTAGTTACIVIFRIGHIFVSNCGDSTAVMGIRNLTYSQPDKPPLIASVLTKDHRPGTLWRKKRLRNFVSWYSLACNGLPVRFVLMSANNYAITCLDTVGTLYL